MMAKRMQPRSFRLDPDSLRFLDARTSATTSRAEVMRRSLARLEAILGYVEIDLASDELDFLAETMRSLNPEMQYIDMLPVLFARAMKVNPPGKEYRAIADSVKRKLNDMDLTQKVAVVDALERRWAEEERGEVEG